MDTEERMKMVCCEQISKMKHALGIGNAKEYHRHGKRYIKSYRNYYQTNNPDKKWEELIEFGMAEKEIVNEKYIYYSVTKKGITFMEKQEHAIIKETD